MHLFSPIAVSSSLECHVCGRLSPDAQNLQDCHNFNESSPSSLSVCTANEACVTYVRHYKIGSGEIV